MLDRVLKAYNWAHYFLHCGLRQHDLFEHRGVDRPQLALLPNEQIIETFEEILNFGASQEAIGTEKNRKAGWGLEGPCGEPHSHHLQSGGAA